MLNKGRFTSLGLLSILLSIFGSGSFAYDVGDVAYLCTKDEKFLWVVGQDSWTACPVRILQRAGESYKVLAHRESCFLPGFGSGMISKGNDAWVENYDLWSSRGACENQGNSTKPTAPKPNPIRSPSANNATSYDIIAELEDRINQLDAEEADPLAKSFRLLMLTAMISGYKDRPSAFFVENNCDASVFLTFRWDTRNGNTETMRWKLEPDENGNSYSLTANGEPVADGRTKVLMHARTIFGREIWAGSQGSAKYGADDTAFFREIGLYGYPRYIELCPE